MNLKNQLSSESATNWCAIKIDISKAYDRMKWEYIYLVMNGSGFSSSWCDLIYNCISSSSYSILLNGLIFDKFGASNAWGKVILYLHIICWTRMLEYAEQDTLSMV